MLSLARVLIKLKPFKPYSALLVTSHCAVYARRFCVSTKSGKGRGGWGHLQVDIHMVAAKLGCQTAMVSTRWANSCPRCMDRLGKCYSHLLGGSSAGKAAWALSECMTIENADHCMLVKGVGVVKVTSLLAKAGSGLRLSVLESDCTSQWPG